MLYIIKFIFKVVDFFICSLQLILSPLEVTSYGIEFMTQHFIGTLQGLNIQFEGASNHSITLLFCLYN